jgi:large subunit ribosomal protein L15
MDDNMTTRKRSKRVKFRGSRNCGWGKHSKHRGHGNQGGAGMAGTKKHKKTWVVKFAPGHIGKLGFHSLQQRNLRVGEAAVNVSDLEKMAAGKKELEFAGKVLGSGQVGGALIVKADYFTQSAKAKIEKAGGKAILIEEKAE